MCTSDEHRFMCLLRYFINKLDHIRIYVHAHNMYMYIRMYVLYYTYMCVDFYSLAVGTLA